jgi:general secretion pathway protein A
MYLDFYGLREKPFALTPNPRFVFYSRQYREAEDQLLYGLNHREGFMLLTGQPGTGKTTLCRDLLEKMDRTTFQSAFIFNPFLNGTEMLAALLTEFGISYPPEASRKDLLERLNRFLLAQLVEGKHCVAIFDEAQHLSPEFLEQIRVLSNLETDNEKLLQIILVGQPELLDRLRTGSMVQLDQRVSIRCQLGLLSEREVDRYVHHRLDVAGARATVPFTARALGAVSRASKGIPRLINLICDRALLAGFAAQSREITHTHVQRAVAALSGEEVELSAAESDAPRRFRLSPAIAATLAFLLLGAAGGGGYAYWKHSQPVVETPETIFWKAAAAPNPRDAEALFGDLVQRFPTSPWSADALTRLAQLATAHGDQSAALAWADQLARTTQPDAAARADLLRVPLLMATGDSVGACTSLTRLRRALPDTATALKSHVVNYEVPCAAFAVAALPEPADTASSVQTGAVATVTRPDSTFAVRAPVVAPAGPADTVLSPDLPFSIQVGLYAAAADAEAHRDWLREKGHRARVVANRNVFRVDIGQFATHAEATKEASRLKEQGVEGSPIQRALQ